MFYTNRNDYGYYIEYYSKKIFSWDRDIIKLLSLSQQEYKSLLFQFNAHEKGYVEYYFTDYKDCEKCVNYLNDTYGVILKLIGDNIYEQI